MESHWSSLIFELLFINCWLSLLFEQDDTRILESKRKTVCGSSLIWAVIITLKEQDSKRERMQTVKTIVATSCDISWQCSRISCISVANSNIILQWDNNITKCMALTLLTCFEGTVSLGRDRWLEHNKWSLYNVECICCVIFCWVFSGVGWEPGSKCSPIWQCYWSHF